MIVIFKEMDQETFKLYLADHINEYAHDRMISDFETFEEVKQVSKTQIENTLAQGLETSNHYLYKVVEAELQKHVGNVWLHINPENNMAFLNHIIIFEAHRRQGYGAQTMALVKQQARQLCCKQLWLNVFGHNKNAQQFYESLGFQTAAIHMNILLDNSIFNNLEGLK